MYDISYPTRPNLNRPASLEMELIMVVNHQVQTIGWINYTCAS